MSALNDEDRHTLLYVARSVITAQVTGNEFQETDRVAQALTQKRGCFVTLHKKGMLRGCIGTIEPVSSLISGVRENALNAAFHDPRFPPVEEDELSEIEIEISILTVPEKLEYTDDQDLKAKLEPGEHGVILSKGWHRSTFLPQVWEQLPKAEAFLAHLCQKAGLDRNCWKNENPEIKVYKAEYFSESG